MYQLTWVISVKSDLKFFNIHLTDQEIKVLSKNKFKSIVKEKVQAKAFIYLQSIKESHTKVKDLTYIKNKVQPYILNEKLTTKEKQLLFKLRTHMIDVKENFKGQYLDVMCNFGCYQTESQYHLLNCDMIIRHCPQLYNDLIIEYGHMYGLWKY